MDGVKDYFNSKANKNKYKAPDIYLSEKISGYNVFACVLYFNDISEFNDLNSTVNMLFDSEINKASS